MYLKCGLTIIVSLWCSFLQAADQKEPLSKQWVALAHDLSLGKIGYFHWLPADIQANIFSRIHPEPTLDDWYPNNVLCIKNVTVPHLIASFDIKGDRLAYMARKMEEYVSYKPYWIDLKTNDYYSTYALADVEHAGEEVPRVEWCGDAILFEQSSKNPVEKALFAVNIFGKHIGSHAFNVLGEHIGRYSVAYIENLQPHDTWKAHPSMPLLVISQGLHKYFFYRIYNEVTHFYIVTHRRRCSRVLSWSARLPQASIYSPSESITHTILPVAVFPIATDYSVGDEYILHCSKGEPYFSHDSISVYAKHASGLLKYNTILKENTVLSLPENKNNFLLRGVGNCTYLAEDINAKGNGTKTYSLCSLNDNSDVSLTELSNLPPLHKLPLGDDYRLVTIVPDEKTATSTIKIMVPQLPILFKHYCMLNAVLEAQKEKNEAVWDIFDAQENKILIEEAKKIYPLVNTLISKKEK